tara:strand:- start:682 stop:972 length:291 start_codon:yes stop_codon:yes gene_type:complete
MQYCNRKKKMDYQTQEYKGHTLLALPTTNPKYPFRFGLKKAELILENIRAIEAFVADHSESGVAVSTYRAEATDYPRTPQVPALNGMTALGKELAA